MVLRQLPPQEDTQGQSKRIVESVELARQAVQLDVTDGTSWCECITLLLQKKKRIRCVPFDSKWKNL